MTFLQLKYFVEVAHASSFTKAAQNLYVAQPNLSKNIAALEREIGFRLFHRGKTKLELTQEGLLLYNRFMDIPRILEETIEEARTYSKNKIKSITIGIMQDTEVDDIIMGAYQKMVTKYPNYRVVIERCDFPLMRKGLKTKRFDAIVTPLFEIDREDRIAYKTITRQKTYIAANKKLFKADKEYVTAEDLEALKSVVIKDSQFSDASARDSLDAAGIQHLNTVSVDTMETYILNVELGNCIALVGSGSYLKNSSNVRLLKLENDLYIDIVLAWNIDNHNPMLSEITDAINLTQMTKDLRD